MRGEDVALRVDGDREHHLVHRIARLAHAGGEREVAVLRVDRVRPRGPTGRRRVRRHRLGSSGCGRGGVRASAGRKKRAALGSRYWCGPVEKFSTATLPPRGRRLPGETGQPNRSVVAGQRRAGRLPDRLAGKAARLEEAGLPRPFLRCGRQFAEAPCPDERARVRARLPSSAATARSAVSGWTPEALRSKRRRASPKRSARVRVSVPA